MLRCSQQTTMFALFLVCIGVTSLFFPLSNSAQTNEISTASRHRRNYPFAKGELTDLDLNKRSLQILTRDGTKTFFYTDRTYFVRMKEKVTADQLKTGDFVRLNFYLDENGNEVIRRLKAEIPVEPIIQDELPPSDQLSQEGQ